ncbi:MAG: hypothetical protein ACLQVL_06885 [Terriglobia bacterium]
MGTTIAGAGLEGVIARESEICYIDGYQQVAWTAAFAVRVFSASAPLRLCARCLCSS